MALDAKHLLSMEEAGDGSAAEVQAPSAPLPPGRTVRRALLAAAALASAGAAAVVLALAKGSSLAQAAASNAILEVESAGPYDAWHINHGSQDGVKSKSGVPYSLKHGKREEIGNYADWAGAQAAKHGGAWMLTYREDGKEYLCKTEPGPHSKIHNGDTYEAYWKPVFHKLSQVHDIIDAPAAAKVCEQSYALHHVKHGGEAKSKSGVGYALGHVVSRAGSWAAADKSTAGGAWMLTKKESGKEYLCKTYPGPDTHVDNGDTYEAYWKPVFHSLSEKHGIISGAGNADICEES